MPEGNFRRLVRLEISFDVGAADIDDEFFRLHGFVESVVLIGIGVVRWRFDLGACWRWRDFSRNCHCACTRPVPSGEAPVTAVRLKFARLHAIGQKFGNISLMTRSRKGSMIGNATSIRRRKFRGIQSALPIQIRRG